MTPLHRTSIVAAIAAMIVIVTAASAGAAQLQSNVRVSNDTITLGDLFDDAGTADAAVVANAPPPGVTGALSVSRISLIARRNGLAWRNKTGVTRIMVTRTGDPIPQEQVQSAIADEVAERSISIPAGSVLQVDFDAKSQTLYVAEGESQTVKVERLSLDRRTGRFQALLRAPADDPGSRLRKVKGRAYPVVEIPVVTRQVTHGEVIGERDVSWIKLPTDRVSRNVITSAHDLIGMSPRRTVRVGRPVRTGDIEPPVVVEKGSLVSVTYNSRNMTLTTRGKALHSGAMGEAINILNMSSRRTIQGVVTAPNEVQIDRIAPTISASAS